MMTTELIQTIVTPALPEAGDFDALQKLFGISRTMAHKLEREKLIKFIPLRKPGNRRAARVLVNFFSVREYLKKCESGEIQ